MVFWIAILAGVLFAWLAVRLGFYAMWIMLFNILLSMYVAIFLAPAIADFAPAPGGAAYSMALSMIVLAGGCFAILHGLSYVFLTGQFNIPFPRMFDILLSGALGFMTGFLILSFVALVLTTTPLAKHEIVSSVGFNEESQRPSLSCLTRSCDLIHAVAGFDGQGTTSAAIHRLLDTGRNLGSKSKAQEPDANEPPATPPPKAPRREPVTRRKIVEPP